MILSNNAEIANSAVKICLRRLINQTYKLLPNREENIDWQTPLLTIIEEFSGMSKLLLTQQDTLFSLICKLEGLLDLTDENDFFLYRRTIFECLGLMKSIDDSIESEA